MFFTQDGVQVNLEDEVYVICLRQKTNKTGRTYATSDPYDVEVFKFRVFGLHNTLEFDDDGKKMHAAHYSGAAWKVSDLINGGNSELGVRTHQIAAHTFNTFSTRELAEKALPEFQQRGLYTFANTARFLS